MSRKDDEDDQFRSIASSAFANDPGVQEFIIKPREEAEKRERKEAQRILDEGLSLGGSILADDDY